MDLKRRLQLFLIGLLIGSGVAYLIYGQRLTTSAWLPEAKVIKRLRSTLIASSPSATDALAQWPADLSALRLSMDSASIDFGASKRTDDSIVYDVTTRLQGRDAHLRIGVLRDFDRDTTATLLEIR